MSHAKWASMSLQQKLWHYEVKGKGFTHLKLYQTLNRYSLALQVEPGEKLSLSGSKLKALRICEGVLILSNIYRKISS